MKNHFKILKADIKRELASLESLKLELAKVYPKSIELSIKIRTTAGILHDFYTGIEKIFQRIATEMDGEIPKGEDWHIDLLKRMAISLPQIRPEVIGEKLARELEEYLRFRHLFRNIYGFGLRWERIDTLAKALPKILKKFEAALQKFFQFLDKLSKNMPK